MQRNVTNFPTPHNQQKLSQRCVPPLMLTRLIERNSWPEEGRSRVCPQNGLADFEKVDNFGKVKWSIICFLSHYRFWRKCGQNGQTVVCASHKWLISCFCRCHVLVTYGTRSMGVQNIFWASEKQVLQTTVALGLVTSRFALPRQFACFPVNMSLSYVV